MVKVEGGSFKMGDDQDIDSRAIEQPVHTVSLKTFSIAKTETTVLQWKTYCNAYGRKMPKTPEWGWKDDHPIVNLSWDDAVAYCSWLSDKTGNLYRLPTEAEWEFAARGGQQSKGFKFSGGQSIDGIGWIYENSNGSPKQVAQKRANELGLYDMSGNAWEWCHDWYGYYAAEAQVNPQGPTSGNSRVLRGGSYSWGADASRVAYRDRGLPRYPSESYGFRVVISQ
ncbi:MAG: SUMF1/EgtB/PvdO family nonheme iron enzyme [Bacteroidia bacterium]|nr:SUMF1/EgtB/PvdO family nonheme iron enzyme [Bacteroidia bacterium]